MDKLSDERIVGARSPADLDAVFSALSDRTRRSVIQRLGSGPASVGDLARDYEMALPSFLKHIRALETCGLIRTRKTGRVRSCSLSTAALGAVERWLAEQRLVWEGRGDRLAALVEAESGAAAAVPTTERSEVP